LVDGKVTATTSGGHSQRQEADRDLNPQERTRRLIRYGHSSKKFPLARKPLSVVPLLRLVFTHP
jgi:hypothetical protein